MRFISHRILVLVPAVVLLSSCDDDDDPAGPSEQCTVSAVAITGAGSDPVVVGTPRTLTADVTSQNCATAPTVTWSSSNNAVISVDGGVVTAVTAGGPVTITATAGGKSGTVEMNAIFATVTGDTRAAYAWAYDETADAYEVDGGYELNAGGPINIVRAGPGVYAVTFTGAAASAGQKENVQVVAYGGIGARCKLASWESAGADLRAQVRCHTPAGLAVDSNFDIFVAGTNALQGRFGFIQTASATAESQFGANATTHTSSRQPVRVTRVGTGEYVVRFFGLGRTESSGPETIQVTAVGDDAAYCSVEMWDDDGVDLTANVRCFAAGGAAADTRFSMLVLENGRAGQGIGFAWANDAGALAPYAPLGSYALNSALDAITVTRTGVGVYNVAFASLVRIGGADETLLVTAYGTSGAYCVVGGWNLTTGTVTIRCADATGAAVDSQFQVLWIQ